MISIWPLAILVGIDSAWKNDVMPGSQPVGPVDGPPHFADAGCGVAAPPAAERPVYAATTSLDDGTTLAMTKVMALSTLDSATIRTNLRGYFPSGDCAPGVARRETCATEDGVTGALHAYRPVGLHGACCATPKKVTTTVLEYVKYKE